MSGVLACQEIADLIERGQIASDPDIIPAQIQPASLDLRLGNTAWRVRASFLAGKDAKVFRYNEFPVRGGDFKSYMSRHSDEPYQAKFSDFNLLLACPAILGEEVSYEIAEAVGAKEEFSQKLCGRLDDLFVSKSLF